MEPTRLQAFSDGVIAIILTIMVLEMKAPHGNNLAALQPLIPVFFSYVLSFAYVGIYWNNHHHLFHVVEKVNGPILWANLHLLFWLSLIPFVTAWMGENHFAAWPVALYGVVLMMAAVAYYFLTRNLIKQHEQGSQLATAIGNDLKGKVSVAVYIAAIPLSFISQWLACALYVIMAIVWFIPDRRIERSSHR